MTRKALARIMRRVLLGMRFNMTLYRGLQHDTLIY